MWFWGKSFCTLPNDILTNSLFSYPAVLCSSVLSKIQQFIITLAKKFTIFSTLTSALKSYPKYTLDHTLNLLNSFMDFRSPEGTWSFEIWKYARSDLFFCVIDDFDILRMPSIENIFICLSRIYIPLYESFVTSDAKFKT